IKEAIDEAENFALKILEQIYFPNNPSAWGQASVKRSDKFQPDNPDDVAQKLVERYISQRVPAGRTALINLVKKLLDMDGIAYQPEEVEAEVDEFLANPVGVPGVDGTPGGDGQSGLIPQITRRDNERVRLLRQTVESIQAREEEQMPHLSREELIAIIELRKLDALRDADAAARLAAELQDLLGLTWDDLAREALNEASRQLLSGSGEIGGEELADALETIARALRTTYPALIDTGLLEIIEVAYETAQTGVFRAAQVGLRPSFNLVD